MKAYPALRGIFALIGLLSSLAFVGNYLIKIIDVNGSIEEARLSSPSKKYDAVITTKGTPMSFGTPRFELFIVPFGMKFIAGKNNFKYALYDANSYGIEDIKWNGDKNLIISRCSNCRVWDFEPIYYDLINPNATDNKLKYKKVYLNLINHDK